MPIGRGFWYRRNEYTLLYVHLQVILREVVSNKSAVEKLPGTQSHEVVFPFKRSSSSTLAKQRPELFAGADDELQNLISTRTESSCIPSPSQTNLELKNPTLPNVKEWQSSNALPASSLGSKASWIESSALRLVAMSTPISTRSHMSSLSSP